MPNYLRWALRLIGPVLLIYFLSTLDLQKLGAILLQLELWPLLLSLALMPLFILVKAWRWNLLLRELGVEAPSLGFSSAIYAVGLFLGATTPGQSGDFVKALYLRERGQPMAPVLFSILLDRLFDFAIMAPLALLSLVVFGNLFPPVFQAFAVAAAAGFLVVLPVLLARTPREWLFGLLLRVAPGRVRPALERWRTQFAGLNTRPALLFRLVLATFGSAFSTMLRIYLLFLALRLFNVPVLAVVASTALISLLQALPISFSGLGVRDAVLVAMLGLYGHSREVAITLSALFLLLNIEHILFGFAISLRYPLGNKSAETNVSSSEAQA